MQVKRHCKYFAFILVVLCCAVIISIRDENMKKENFIHTKEYVVNIAKQASEWLRAASVDPSPLMENMHSNYAVSLFFALKHALNDDICKEIVSKVSNDNYQKFLEGSIPQTVWTMKIPPTKKK